MIRRSSIGNIINIGIMYIVLYILIIKNNNNIEIDYRIIGGKYIIDDINITLIILTTIITPIIYIMKLREEERRKVEIIQIIIIIILLTNDLFHFFIFYELLLIPMYIYLIGYGSKYMKIEAAYRLIIYRIIGFVLPLFNDLNQSYKVYIFILSIISIVYGAIINIREIDMKKIIAYSSIIHMNYSIFGLFSKELSSIISSYILMLSHGFI